MTDFPSIARSGGYGALRTVLIDTLVRAGVGFLRTERVFTKGTPHFDPHEPFIPFLKRILSLASDSMNCRFQPDFEIVDRLKVQKGLSEVLTLLQLELANLLLDVFR